MNTIKFQELGLVPTLLHHLARKNFSKTYPIQEQAIPAILKGKDILGIAKTGSGKTLSYVLPILQQLQQSAQNRNRHVKVLVIVPTRELAVQVSEVFKTFSVDLPERVKTLAVFGGVSINPQMIALQNVSVLVATPGRLLELIDAKAIAISEIKTLVLDEADKMLNTAFKEEMERIFGLLPVMRQTLLFSATLNEDAQVISKNLLYFPVVIKPQDVVEEDHLDLINQTAYFIEDEKKGALLRYLIEEKKMEQVLIFASSIQQVNLIEKKLYKNGIFADVIHSKCSQKEREETIRDFKSGRVKVLVATDLLARGIDIEYLPYVINYELPRSPKDYIHRIGRTGRAEKTGNAITFVSPEEEHHFKVIQKKMKKWVDRVNMEDIVLD